MKALSFAETGMEIHLDPTLESVLTESARQQGVSAETLALNALRDRFLPSRIEPKDEWERRLLQAASHCGVAPPPSAFSRDEIYD